MWSCRTATWTESLEGKILKKTLTAHLWPEGGWIVAQCLEVDVASQGETETEALANLREALHLHFSPPVATLLPTLKPVEVELAA